MKIRYKIAYGNIIKCIIANTGRFIINFFAPYFICMLLSIIVSTIIKSPVSEKICPVIFLIGIIVNIFTIIVTFIPQYIELNESCIKVKRFVCIATKHSIIGKYSFKLPYSEIVDIEWIVDSIDYLNSVPARLFNGSSIYTCDFNNTLLIHTRSGFCRDYVISVKNSDDFYKRVLSSIDRIKFLKELNIDELIVGYGIDYNDLKLCWKKQNLDSVYFIDNNNAKITVAQFEYDKSGKRYIKA